MLTSLLEFYPIEKINDVIFSKTSWCFQVIEDCTDTFVKMMDGLKDVLGNVFPPISARKFLDVNFFFRSTRVKVDNIFL